MPKLSIITINYNNKNGLEKTIRSVISQVSTDFEYIIIDGGSTDGSLELIKSHEDKITFWESMPDDGIYHAMNKGIDKAKGEFCQFLNSGDFLVNENVVYEMLKNMPNCSILYGNKIKLLSNGKILYNKKIPINSFLTFYNGTLNHASAYIKKSLFDMYGGYDENLKIVSDWKFYLIAIVLNNEKVEYKDVDVCYFEMSGISNQNRELCDLERRKVLQELIPHPVLSDYDNFATGINQMKRINKYKLTKLSFWLLDRVLFKIEKYNTRRKKEQIFYSL